MELDFEMFMKFRSFGWTRLFRGVVWRFEEEAVIVLVDLVEVYIDYIFIGYFRGSMWFFVVLCFRFY